MVHGEWTIEELEAEAIPKKTQQELDELREAIARLKEVRHYVVPLRQKGNTIRFAVASDDHVGSLYERFDAQEAFYETLRREKIRTILKPGDILDGHDMYKGQTFEQYAHGMDKQLTALQQHHPDTKGMDIHFITGNHDFSFYKIAGTDPGKRIVEEMGKGWHYAGRDRAWVDLRTRDGYELSVALLHPAGGTTYALSYRPQKITEKIPGGMKPDILLIGHYHKAEYIPGYRNVDVFQAGCFQSQTPFMAAKPTEATVGGWIIEVTLADRRHLVRRVKAEFISFFEPSQQPEVRE